MRRLLQLAFLVLAAAGLTLVYENYVGYVRTYLERRFYPPLRLDPSASFGGDIQREAAQRRLNQIFTDGRRVQALLEAARAQGHDVAEPEAKLAYALQLARQGRFADAKIYLNIAELKIPRASERLRPAASEDAANPFPDLEAPRSRRRP